MQTVLDNATTWFLESFQQGPYDSLVIRLAEGGYAGPEQTPKVGELELGIARPMATARDLRVAQITFKHALAFFTMREMFDATDSSLEFESHHGYIRRVERSHLQEFVRAATGVYATWIEDIHEYHVWTEEQIFQVFSCEPPEVVILPDKPDTSIERGETWMQGKAI